MNALADFGNMYIFHQNTNSTKLYQNENTTYKYQTQSKMNKTVYHFGGPITQ
jgi:hypothetical protein